MHCCNIVERFERAFGTNSSAVRSWPQSIFNFDALYVLIPFIWPASKMNFEKIASFEYDKCLKPEFWVRSGKEINFKQPITKALPVYLLMNLILEILKNIAADDGSWNHKIPFVVLVSGINFKADAALRQLLKSLKEKQW